MSTGHVLQYVLPSVLEYFVINIFLLEFVKPALIPYLNIFNNQQFERKKRFQYEWKQMERFKKHLLWGQNVPPSQGLGSRGVSRVRFWSDVEKGLGHWPNLPADLESNMESLC